MRHLLVFVALLTLAACGGSRGTGGIGQSFDGDFSGDVTIDIVCRLGSQEHHTTDTGNYRISPTVSGNTVSWSEDKSCGTITAIITDPAVDDSMGRQDNASIQMSSCGSSVNNDGATCTTTVTGGTISADWPNLDLNELRSIQCNNGVRCTGTIIGTLTAGP